MNSVVQFGIIWNWRVPEFSLEMNLGFRWADGICKLKVSLDDSDSMIGGDLSRRPCSHPSFLPLSYHLPYFLAATTFRRLLLFFSNYHSLSHTIFAVICLPAECPHLSDRGCVLYVDKRVFFEEFLALRSSKMTRKRVGGRDDEMMTHHTGVTHIIIIIITLTTALFSVEWICSANW